MASAAVRRTSARIAAHMRWSKEDPVEGTKTARDAFLARFERLADPDGVLDPKERQRRAESLKRAHFTQLALKSAKSRAAKATPTSQRVAAAIAA